MPWFPGQLHALAQKQQSFCGALFFPPMHRHPHAMQFSKTSLKYLADFMVYNHDCGAACLAWRTEDLSGHITAPQAAACSNGLTAQGACATVGRKPLLQCHKDYLNMIKNVWQIKTFTL